MIVLHCISLLFHLNLHISITCKLNHQRATEMLENIKPAFTLLYQTAVKHFETSVCLFAHRNCWKLSQSNQTIL